MWTSLANKCKLFCENDSLQLFFMVLVEIKYFDNVLLQNTMLSITLEYYNISHEMTEDKEYLDKN